ncbi:SLC13 family permease [Aeromicrobium ponti]|uniref:Di/tricarboxylate transporter n=1 Tax=Cytobacillus oceanisediminis TaxID=665099 RepID=A0A562K582_9BACI|nr:SLC13 family permease [Cytobacillus oceanisediminis]TWH90580.1 di/tricarboxylate transporter [Cytobacillus oceanisediminis]
MSIDAIVLCIILSFMFFALISEWVLPEFTVFLALSSLIFFKIATPAEALKGFANPGVHTVAFLFIVGAAVSKTGILHDFVHKILNQNKSIQYVLIRLMLPTSTISAFMNNTPIVTMLIPTLQNWAINNNIKPSKLLIPLSYAAILGGTITLIGTSTNLIVQGLLAEKGLSGFKMFDFAYFGIPLTFAGILYFVIAGHRLLPERAHNIKLLQDEQHHFIYKFIVETNSALIGKSIKDAMLRNLNHLFLIEIIRSGKAIIPAPNDEIIQEEDILVFSGNPDSVLQVSHILGLKLSLGDKGNNHSNLPATFLEVGISGKSPLINKKIKESQFRSRYNAAIVAIKRNGKFITSGIGNFVLKQGDTLLLLGKNDFVKTWTNSEDFYFISPINKKHKNIKHEKLVIILILMGIIITSVFQLMSIFSLALISALIVVLTKIITFNDAIKSINWNVIIMMASAIGIGNAIETTGLARFIASFFTEVQSYTGLIGILFLFYFVTLIMTEFLNNLATAAIMFPIGYTLSLHSGLDPKMLAMLTAISASCSFLTPIGYQTNLLVYGPGGYKFTDFMKVGLPLSLICMFLSIFIAYWKWL